MGMFYEEVRDRLLAYAQIGTQSARFSGSWPTTACQFDLARLLQKELLDLGASDVYLDEESCLVYARIPGTLAGKDAAPLGLIAHMDTAPDAPGAPVKPWVLENYDGGDVVLNPEKGIVMKAAEYPSLSSYPGQDLVLTDGTTLLGGDDKAAIAALMTLAAYYCSHPEVSHCPVCLAFTPDEEVGGLARDLDLARFGAPCAYTLDGDHLGWYMDETFNAAGAHVKIRGKSVHTGTAKGILVNAVDIASGFMEKLPREEKPRYTEGTQGFFHMVSCQAVCEEADLELIIRDFDAAAFEERKDLLRTITASLNEIWGEGTVTLTIYDQYRNMKEVLDSYPHLVEDLKAAIRAAGLAPVSQPFRGGTDGAALCFRGLPCPNLSAGYENAHSRFEYVPIQSMEKNVEILLHLCAR
ncbi:MAG: peptidase T [Lachnospiraceae bacterium]|nr:peptidase T [Lachnospiraceae bacterium]